MLSITGFEQKIGTFECWVLLAVWVGLLGIYLAVYIRRKRTERRLPVEITNLGNVETNFRLRVEEASGAMTVRFLQKGKRLPLVVEPGVSTAAPALAYAGAHGSTDHRPDMHTDKVRQGSRLVNSFSRTMINFGSILPAPVRRPLVQALNRIQEGQLRVGLAEGKINRTVGYLPTFPSSKKRVPTAAVVETGLVWAETPAVRPGESLKVIILLRAAWSKQDQSWPFRLLSYSPQAVSPQMMVKESQVHVKGGFLSHAFYPPLVVTILTAAVVFVLFWVRSAG